MSVFGHPDQDADVGVMAAPAADSEPSCMKAVYIVETEDGELVGPFASEDKAWAYAERDEQQKSDVREVSPPVQADATTANATAPTTADRQFCSPVQAEGWK